MKLTLAAALLLFHLTLNAQVTIRTNILNITAKLQRGKSVHFGLPVGISGELETNNRYYKLYEKLGVRATTEELVELTKHTSALIVVYAFDILQQRNYDGLKNIFLEHVNDTIWFWTAGGCTGVIDRVNWFMLRRLKPVDGIAGNRLSKSEYDLYCNRFKKEDEMFSCH